MQGESIKLLSRGVAAHQAGKLEDASALYQQLLDEEPDNLDGTHLLGLIAHQRGQHEEAVRLISQAIVARPDIAQFHCHCADAYLALDCVDQSLSHLRQAHALIPDNPEILINLAELLQRTGQLIEAATFLNDALSLMLQQNRDSITSPRYSRAVDYCDDYLDAHSRLAEIYLKLGDNKKAQSHAMQALSAKPNKLDTNITLGNIYLSNGKLQQAESYYRIAIGIDPDNAATRWNLARALLGQGQFSEGWQEYQWRFKAWSGLDYISDPRIHPGERRLANHILPRPADILPIHWQNKRVLLRSEQGVAEELLFLRYIPKLQALGARVFYDASASLRPLLIKHPVVELWHEQQYFDADIDYVFSVGDLPLLTAEYRMGDATPNLTLQPSTALKQQLLNYYADLPRPWVGLSWQHSLDLPALLDTLIPQLTDNGGTLFILQSPFSKQDKVCVQQRSKGQDAVQCIDASAANDDLPILLAMQALLDDYIGVADTKMYLREALGLNSKIFVPRTMERDAGLSSSMAQWCTKTTLLRENQHGWADAISKLRENTADSKPG